MYAIAWVVRGATRFEALTLPDLSRSVLQLQHRIPTPEVMADTVRSQLVGRFGDAVAKDEAVMTECLSICRLYALSPSELYYKWEAFLLNHFPSPRDTPVKLAGAPSGAPLFDLENARELKKEIQREAAVAQKGGDGTFNNAAQAAAGLDGVTPIKRDGFGLSAGVRSARRGKGAPAEGLDGILGNLGVPTTPLTSRALPRQTVPGSATPTARPPVMAQGKANGFVTPVRPGLVKDAESSSPLGSPSVAHDSGRGPSTPFSSRHGPLTVVETLNVHLDATHSPAGAGVSAGSKVSLAAATDPRLWKYRYMFEKAGERSEVLDDRIDEFAELLRSAYPSEIEEFDDPTMAFQDEIYAFGRIAPDLALSTSTGANKLSEQSLLLETSRTMGSGARVPLRFDEGIVVRGNVQGAGGIGLFPGMLVGVRGKNGGGGVFTVREVLLLPPLPLAVSQSSDLLTFHHSPSRLDGRPLSVYAAAGPFTLDSDLEYEPFAALVDELKRAKPDLVLLLGPFVDSAHPLLKVGDTDHTPAQLFRHHISSRLADLIDLSPSTTVILIPSTRDLIHAHVAFPQTMLERSEELGIPKRVKLLPNPSVFSVNEVVFGVSTTDVLFHLRKEEYFRRIDDGSSSSASGGAGADAMARLCRHVLCQRSFYPLFPSPQGTELNLDVTHQHLLRIDGVAPDVLILPSMLKHFTKVVDSTVVINPSSLCRSQSGGHFAKLAVHPFDRSVLETNTRAAAKKGEAGGDGDEAGQMEHAVWERARVDMVRL